MAYDYIFTFDPCGPFNSLEGSGIYHDCGGFLGQDVEVRHSGFLFGNVVDMFKFQAEWPSWVPWLGGKNVFPAIWNLADASITLGVIMVFFRQRKYFPQEKSEKKGGFFRRRKSALDMMQEGLKKEEVIEEDLTTDATLNPEENPNS